MIIKSLVYIYSLKTVKRDGTPKEKSVYIEYFFILYVQH